MPVFPTFGNPAVLVFHSLEIPMPVLLEWPFMMRIHSWLCLLITWSGLVNCACGDHKTITIDHGGTDLVCELNLVDVRGPRFSVVVQNDDGAIVPYAGELPAPRTYIGRIKGSGKFSGAVIAGSMDSTGRNFSGVLNLDRGVEYPVEENKTLVDKVRGLNFVPAYDLPTQGTVAPGKHRVWAFENAIDVRNSYLRRRKFVDDVPAAIAYIEEIAVKNAAVYLRDVKFFPQLGKVLLRTSQSHCPYEGLRESSELKPVLKNQWKEIDDGYNQYTGFVGGGNSDKGYNVSSFDDIVWRHELCHSIRDRAIPIDHPSNNAEGPTIMSRNIYYKHAHLGRFSGASVALLHINRAYVPENYTDLGLSFTNAPLPPYAALDTYQISRKPKGRGQVELDVLANDFDANNDPLVLISCDTTSHRGRPVKIVPNADGRKVVVYDTGPDNIGLDYFFYRIKETGGSPGQTATGMVIVDLQNPFKFYPAGSKEISSSATPKSMVFATGSSGCSIKKPDSFVKLTTDVFSKGLYGLKIRYSYAERGDPRGYPIVVTVNKNTSRQKVFRRTLGTSFVQHSWQYATIPLVMLERGKNTVHIQPEASGNKQSTLHINGLILSKGVDIRVNFQSAALKSKLGETIHEYFPDTGPQIGEREANLTFGWNKDVTGKAGKTGKTEDKRRDPSRENSWGQLHYNSYIAPANDEGWRIKLPQGRYNVFMVCGALYGRNDMIIQDVPVMDRNGPETYNTYEQIVDVGSAGTLTIRPGPQASNASISFIMINDIAPGIVR